MFGIVSPQVKYAQNQHSKDAALEFTNDQRVGLDET
jgi:hypothetical protein